MPVKLMLANISHMLFSSDESSWKQLKELLKFKFINGCYRRLLLFFCDFSFRGEASTKLDVILNGNDF